MLLAKRSITLRVFVTKVFRRFQRKEKIDDEALCEAIARSNALLDKPSSKFGIDQARFRTR
jgi:hypothetical protein